MLVERERDGVVHLWINFDKDEYPLVACGNTKAWESNSELTEVTCRDCIRLSSRYDPVSVPKHYNSHPSGVECIEITKHMNYCLGNVIKYVWRAGLKGEAIEDLEKAATYLQYEIERLRSI